jgi:transcriptional regulator with XRE-family HTH domain
MVTNRKQVQRRLFLKEHREAKDISAETMAERLGIERESVYRLEKKHDKITAEKQARYAAALGLRPEDLWRPPGAPPSLDSLVSGAPEDVKALAADIVGRLVRQ